MSNTALSESPARDSDRLSIAKFQRIDIDRIKSDANNPQTFFNLLPQLKFRAVGTGYVSQYSGIRLKCKNGTWILQNFNGKFGGAQGDAWNITKRLYNLDSTSKDDLKRLCKILTQASGGQISKIDRSENTAYQTKYVAPEKLKFVPNQGQTLKVSSIPKYADYKSETGLETLTYFSRWQVGEEILQKYNIRPLHSVKYANGGFTRKFDRKDFAYAWTVGGVGQTAKYKRPNAPKGEKERPLQWSGNYVFGWEQLPRDLTEITLIIAAGEKDTLVLNQHFNHQGIYAICFGSETVKMDADFIQDLRSRCKALCTLFDNDNAGEKGMKRAAIEHGIPAIKLNDYFPVNDKKYNDVADVVEYHPQGVKILEKIIFSQILIKTAVQRIPNDPFSLGVYDALKLEVKRYLSEKEVSEQTCERPIESLMQMLLNHKRILLQAAPGVGKSWAVIELAMNTDFLKAAKVERIIHSVPTGLLAAQFQKDFKTKTGIDVPIISEGFTDYDMIDSENYPLLIAVYDSLPKIAGLLDSSLLTIDENHLLADSADFRGNALAHVFDLFGIAKKCLFISATPLLELTTGIYPDFDFKLCVVNSEEQQKVEIQPYISTRGTQTDLFEHWYKTASSDKGKKVLRINDVQKLEIFAQQTNQNKGADVSTILSSKERKYKEENPNYKSLVESGTIAKEYIFSTCLVDTGVSFRDEIGSITMLSPRNVNEIYQFNTRPRMSGELNQTVKAITYHRASPEEAKRIIHQFENPNQSRPTTGRDTLQSLKNAIEIAQRLADDANIYKSSVTTEQRKFYDSRECIIFSEFRQKYIPNIAQILHAEHQRINCLTDVFGLYERLQKLYPNVHVKMPKVIHPKSDQETAEQFAAKKAQRKNLTKQGIELLNKDKNTVLEIQLFRTKSKKERIAIMEELNLLAQPKGLSSAAEKLLADNHQIFERSALDKVLHKFLSLKSLQIAQLTDKAILDFIANNTTAKYRTIYNSLVTQQELKTAQGALSGKSRLRNATAKKIKDRIQKEKDKARKSGKKLRLTKKKITRLVSEVTGEKFTNTKEPLMRIFELFAVRTIQAEYKEIDEEGRERRKRYRIYEIGSPHSLKSLVKLAQKCSENR